MPFAMERAGADLLDIGGESTRPGSVETSASEELDRILPVLEALRGRLKIPISVDTRRASVAELAIRAGAELVNDVSGLRAIHELPKQPLATAFPNPDAYAGRAADDASGGICTGRLERCDSGLRKSVAVARRAGVGKSQNHRRSGHRLRQEFRAELRIAAKTPATREARLSVAGGNIEKGFIGATLASGRQACVTGRANLGTAATVTASILNGGAHCARPRCGRNSAGGARR